MTKLSEHATEADREVAQKAIDVAKFNADITLVSEGFEQSLLSSVAAALAAQREANAKKCDEMSEKYKRGVLKDSAGVWTASTCAAAIREKS